MEFILSVFILSLSRHWFEEKNICENNKIKCSDLSGVCFKKEISDIKKMDFVDKKKEVLEKYLVRNNVIYKPLKHNSNYRPRITSETRRRKVRK